MDLARKFLEQTGINVFLTGKAGTGKTTFLRDLRQSSPKRMIVVAPTGVAAINAGGVTIHSFFQLPFGPHLPGVLRTGGEKRMNFSKEKIAVIRSLDLLVIDEISMVRADLLDAMNDVLRRYRDRDKTVRRRTVADDRGSPATRSCRKTTGMGTARQILRVALLFRQCGAAGSQIHHSGIETCLSAE